MPMFVGSQVSCLSVLWLVRYASRVEPEQGEEDDDNSISNLTPFLVIYFTHFLTRGTF